MKRYAVVDKNICAACGVCLKNCRKDALTIYRGCFAQVDTAKCVGCGLCAKSCPAGCITVKERSDAK